jgi:hypothetical protein
MKTITVLTVEPTETTPPYDTKMIIREVTSGSSKGMTIAQMRNRIKVLDALDKAGNSDTIMLEDSEFDALKEAMNEMAWARADRDLLRVIDGILNAD